MERVTRATGARRAGVLAAVAAALVVGGGWWRGALAQERETVLNQPAPELVGDAWLNTPEGKPVTLASRRGKVTILHFWTFGCINCQRNLPAYARWQKQFEKRDVAVIGVHTPETEGERNPDNVAKELKKLGITYPVILDPKGANWTRWKQAWWPTVYLLDRKGRVRYGWEGELEWKHAGGEAKLTSLVEQLLREQP
jgi:thiol-disulfide isomerase/thioredoxin